MGRSRTHRWTASLVLPETGETSARKATIEKHTARLAGFGITDSTPKEFPVNESLSDTTRAVLRR